MKSGTFSVPLVIKQIDSDKEKYMPLLLLGDESELMVRKYLDRGTLYVGFIKDTAVAVCVTVYVNEGQTEVKNLAVATEWQKKGIGRKMLSWVESLKTGKEMILGTGETPSTLRFYRLYGYKYSHRIDNFFTDNYPEPIIEEGVLLRDMVYFKKQL